MILEVLAAVGRVECEPIVAASAVIVTASCLEFYCKQLIVNKWNVSEEIRELTASNCRVTIQKFAGHFTSAAWCVFVSVIRLPTALAHGRVIHDCDDDVYMRMTAFACLPVSVRVWKLEK